MLSAIRSSVFLQLVALVVVVDAFVSICLPSVIAGLNPEMMHGGLWNKVPQFFSDVQDPDIVIMGSSLVLAPAIHCDAAMLPASDPNKAKIRQHKIHLYDKAKYLEAKLERTYGRDLNIYNLGFPGCMASDYEALVKEMIHSGKHPAFVVLAVAARDFVNATRSGPQDSGLQEAIRQVEKTKNQNFAQRILDLPKTVTKHLSDSKEELLVVKLIATSKINTLRKDGPKSLAKKETPLEEIQLATEESIAMDTQKYKENYKDPQESQVATQLKHLDRTLDLANQAGLPIVLVNLPVTDLHKQLLPADILALYNKSLLELANKHACRLIDFEKDNRFQRTDYRDTVHLNARGGQKFYAELVEGLKEDPLLTNRLSGRLASTGSKVH